MAPSLACLPWYDLPEIRPATDGFWGAVRAGLADAGLAGLPAGLCREVDHDGVLGSEELLLSQTCGLVAVGPARRSVRVVATPRYAAPGCRGSDYRSFVVVPRGARARDVREIGDLRGTRCALNEPFSHSGVNVLRDVVADHLERSGGRGPFFGEVLLAGSHVASLEQVADGRADVAAIDCVTFELLARHRPGLVGRVRVLLTSAPYAAPPFVTSAATDDATLALLRRALAEAVDRVAREPVGRTLLVTGVEQRPLADYEPMLAIEERARSLGLSELELADEPFPRAVARVP